MVDPRSCSLIMLLSIKISKNRQKLTQMKKLLCCIMLGSILYSCSKDEESAPNVPEDIKVDFLYGNDEMNGDQSILVYDVKQDNKYLGSFSKSTLSLKSGQYNLIAVGGENLKLANTENYKAVKLLQNADGQSKLFASSKMIQIPDDATISFEMGQLNGGIQIISTDDIDVGLDSVRVSAECMYDSYQLHNSLLRGGSTLTVQKTFPANGGIGFDNVIHVFPGDVEVSLDYFVDGEIVNTKELGKLTVTAGENIVEKVLFADDVVATVEIIDANFKNALLDILPSDAFLFGKLIKKHESVTSLKELHLKGSGIVDFSGLEAFIGLEKLDCENNKVGVLNLSALVNLKELNCSWCNLSSLDISGCTQLEKLNCVSNMSVKEYDLSNLTQLKWLNCNLSRGITSLDLSNCKQLTYLEAVSCKYTELDLAGLDQLETLICNANFDMTSLNISGCVSLKTLNCKDASITSLDASDCSNLEVLNCQYNNHMVELKISEEASNLTEIHAQGRASYPDITGLSATAQPALEKLYFGESAICGENIKKFHEEGNWIEMKWGVSSGEYLNDYTSESCQ